VRIHENAVDLIITDVQMPKLDGFEMSKMLNVRDKTRDIPVIFLTEVLDEQTKAIAKRLGAADTLVKPFTMDAVFESVRTILASHLAVDTPTQTYTSPKEVQQPALAAVGE
jgi:DNA-binding response OmpR family regulator